MIDLHTVIEQIQTPVFGHVAAFVVNLLVLFFANGLLRPFNHGKDVTLQARALRFGAFLFLLSHVFDLVLVSAFPAYENVFIRFGLTIATFFGCLLLFNITSFFSRQKFGTQREVDGKPIYLDNYNSRLMDLVAAIVIILIALYCLIVIWELEGLLQTTGFLGIFFAFLALTNSIWAPDIYFGLVILNSNMLEDGDVIKIGGLSDELIISRVSFIYTILLDVRNNHRIIVRNSQLINSRVDNLSKRASTDGLRHSLVFNISYPSDFSTDSEKREANPFSELNHRVLQMAATMHERLVEEGDAKINKNIPFEVVLTNSGDYALEYTLFYYVEALPNTKVTKTVRQYLLQTPSLIQQAANRAASEYNIQFATPLLISNVDENVGESIHGHAQSGSSV
ncbi:hypothetical protein NBRC116494_35520 [Aurantivibrio plasticivorans]